MRPLNNRDHVALIHALPEKVGFRVRRCLGMKADDRALSDHPAVPQKGRTACRKRHPDRPSNSSHRSLISRGGLCGDPLDMIGRGGPQVAPRDSHGAPMCKTPLDFTAAFISHAVAIAVRLNFNKGSDRLCFHQR